MYGIALDYTKAKCRGIREDVDLNVTYNWISFDCKMWKGHSGGAILNDEGEMIGVPSRADCHVGDEEVLNLALPIDACRPLIRTARRIAKDTRDRLRPIPLPGSGSLSSMATSTIME